MMYYCPCPCSDPVDPETEENTFLALPRNLSYVQDSYLDAHSVSGRFVFKQRERVSAIPAEGFDLDPNDTRVTWRGDCAPELESASTEVGDEGERENGVGGEEGEERESLLSTVKSQNFPSNFSSDFNSFSTLGSMHSTHSNGGGSDGGIGSAIAGGSSNRGWNSRNNNSDSEASVSAPSSSHSPVASAGVTPLAPSPPPVTASSSSTSAPASFIRRVTSLISPKDETTAQKTDDLRNIHSSSVDVDVVTSTSDTNQSWPSTSALRSPDRSGLIMDRGEDLVSPIAILEDQPTEEGSFRQGPSEISSSDFDGKEEETDEYLISLNQVEVTESDSAISDRNDSGGDLSRSNLTRLVTENTDMSCSSTSGNVCGSPDSDDFSEEGVFVNMLDEADTVEKYTSEVSDDTNVSVDSMFCSPEEIESDDTETETESKSEKEVEGKAELKNVEEEQAKNLKTTAKQMMTLEEAINKAASDFNKITLMMYPEVMAAKGVKREDVPSTSKDFTFSQKLQTRGSPLRGLQTLSVNVNCADSDEPNDGEKQEGHTPKESPIYEDVEFNFNKKTLRKSSSLKTNKTPPGTPHRKKVVRFADAMGLDLESVRHVLNMESPPKIPASAMADLKQGLSDDRIHVGSRYLTACFNQPGASEDFMKSVLLRKVALENAVITDLTITGFIRVANIGYHKSVRVRYTHNNWATFHDIAANYIPNSCDGPTDRFSFAIVAPSYFVPGNRLEFAVSFNAEGVEYWDNNFGNNYVFECFAKTVPTDNDNDWIHFL